MLFTKGQVLKVLCALQPFWRPSAVPWLGWLQGSSAKADQVIWRLPQCQHGVQQGQKAIQAYALSMWKCLRSTFNSRPCRGIMLKLNLAAPTSETCRSFGISWSSWNSISWQTTLSRPLALTCDLQGFHAKRLLARATLMVHKRGCKSFACGLPWPGRERPLCKTWQPVDSPPL